MAIVAAVLALLLVGGEAEGHLFHKMWEPPENQLTRDTRLLQLLLDDPAERFELARLVYEGKERVRLKPGGFRRWLVRPNEPGMVFKADYQLERWSGSLEGELERIDGARGSRLGPRMDTALTTRNRDEVRAVLRETYVVLLEELLGAIWERLDQPETTARLYPLALRYWSVNLEGYFNIRHPSGAPGARAALDSMGRQLGDPETGVPAASHAFDQQRRRFLRILREAIPAAP
jgi:hypothetical protein